MACWVRLGLEIGHAEGYSTGGVSAMATKATLANAGGVIGKSIISVSTGSNSSSVIRSHYYSGS